MKRGSKDRDETRRRAQSSARWSHPTTTGFDLDVAGFRERSLDRLRAHRVLSSASHRRGALEIDAARMPLHIDRARFFEAFELEARGPARGRLWSTGPELTAVFEARAGHVQLERRRVASAGGEVLDPIRTVLLLEYQQLVLDVLAALATDGARDVVSLVSATIEDAAVARTAMRLSGFDGRDETAESVLESAPWFHERLVVLLRRLVLATYENEPAQLGILFVPASRAHALGPRASTDRWEALLERSKLARVLSDGRDTHFVASSTGAYLGLHDASSLRAAGFEPRELFGWRLRAGVGIALHRGGEAIFELHGGRWTFRGDARLRSRLERTEPTLGGANRILWTLARTLSAARSSAILLVVEDPDALAASGACRPDLAVRPTQPRVGAAKRGGRARKSEAINRLHLAPLEEFLLDQLQGRACEEIGEPILSALARVDGALLTDRAGALLGFGVIFASGVPESGREGAGANAARFASRFGTAIHVSTDGPITGYHRGSRV